MCDFAGDESSSAADEKRPPVVDSCFSGSGNTSNTKRARTESTQPRRLWVKNRSNAWWEEVSSPDFPDEDFKKAFRMSRATFDVICEELDFAVTKKDTMLRMAIPVRQRVAVCIWRLATGEALREVSRRFGLGISTCHKLVLEVCTCHKLVLEFLLDIAGSEGGELGGGGGHGGAV